MLLFLDFDGVLHPNAKDKPLFCRVPLLWRFELGIYYTASNDFSSPVYACALYSSCSCLSECPGEISTFLQIALSWAKMEAVQPSCRYQS